MATDNGTLLGVLCPLSLLRLADQVVQHHARAGKFLCASILIWFALFIDRLWRFVIADITRETSKMIRWAEVKEIPFGRSQAP